MLTGTHQRRALVDSFTVTAGDTALSGIYQFRYLGVLLYPYLSCNDQIVYIGRKISAKLCRLRKACKVIPRESCLTLYNAIILPVFNYCDVVWDSCNRADRQHLNKHHKRAASIMGGYTISQSRISCTYGRPMLHSRRDYLKCMLVFKSLHGLAPAYLLNEFSLPLARTAKYQGSFRFREAKIWNTLPLALRSEHDLNKFGLGLKWRFRSKPN